MSPVARLLESARGSWNATEDVTDFQSSIARLVARPKRFGALLRHGVSRARVGAAYHVNAGPVHV